MSPAQPATAVPPIVLVAAVARNGVIGDGQGMPWHVPEDMTHFREVTSGCPVVMGPHTFNFAQASKQALLARAAQRVDNIQAGVKVAVHLATDPDRNAWVQRALGFANAHRGAAALIAQQVLKLVK